jgi:hypothetical protein
VTGRTRYQAIFDQELEEHFLIEARPRLFQPKTCEVDNLDSCSKLRVIAALRPAADIESIVIVGQRIGVESETAIAQEVV